MCLGLQEQLLASQEALKTAKAESARRLKTLQSLQQQVNPHTVPSPHTPSPFRPRLRFPPPHLPSLLLPPCPRRRFPPAPLPGPSLDQCNLLMLADCQMVISK